MIRSPALLFAAGLLALASCKGDEDTEGQTEGCTVPCAWSTADSGGLCQANLYCDDADYAVYCGDLGDGSYDCGCGAAADDPPEFISEDFCELEDEERMCEAMARCSNWPSE